MVKTLTNVDKQAIVVVYPAFAIKLEEGGWKVRISGGVFGENEGEVGIQKRLMLKLFGRILKAAPEQLQSDLFRTRIRGFILNAERGKRIAVRIGSRTFRLKKKSKRNGQFVGTIHLSEDEVQQLSEGRPWLDFEVLTRQPDEVMFAGRAQLIEPRGISVISDIDDTMKHTDVSCRKSLLANTFLRKFELIDGMSSVYQRWADQGALFHYVSSSPWQLFEPLADFCHHEGFPAGTFHLRNFRLRDHMLRKLLLVRRGKASVIKRLVKACPHRRFVLIGDSGERDPEIYGKIARKFAPQIARVFIRDLSERPMVKPRVRRAFQHLPGDSWTLFREAAELPPDLAQVATRAPVAV